MSMTFENRAERKKAEKQLREEVRASEVMNEAILDFADPGRRERERIAAEKRAAAELAEKEREEARKREMKKRRAAAAKRERKARALAARNKRAESGRTAAAVALLIFGALVLLALPAVALWPFFIFVNDFEGGSTSAAGWIGIVVGLLFAGGLLRIDFEERFPKLRFWETLLLASVIVTLLLAVASVLYVNVPVLGFTLSAAAIAVISLLVLRRSW